MIKRDREVPDWYYRQSGTEPPGKIGMTKDQLLKAEKLSKELIEAQLASYAKSSDTDLQPTKKK